ncbi:hypothetical protein TEA_023962 [Camellia sinensis var. sinensis]|uniref:DUF632 domain-containing protein n=1 Tax=Camellia sinensis var. sinensis TaxID=542762 RepID=A0A4S4D055_CAMSN|nr:hypothetical protein TEA_023962 [Camellia sinensis var. sinensis]
MGCSASNIGCSASNTREIEHNVVSISRARKRLIKSAVQSRHELSIAHCTAANTAQDPSGDPIPLVQTDPVPVQMSRAPAEAPCEAVKEAQGKDGDANVNQGENRGLGVNDSCGNGRELMEALKDVVEHFVTACESGVEVSRMLEINTASLLQSSGSEQIQDGPNKIVQPIRWCGSSSSSGPSSFKSFLASSSSMQTEFKNDIFDEYGGMVSGSHSLTLGRLYAWEKKLYEEVKAGDHMRKIYEQICIQLRNQDTRGKGSMDKTRAEVRDLHCRILVAIRTIESISQRIQKAKDEELHPQLVELLHG